MPVDYYKSFKIEKNEYWQKVLTKKEQFCPNQPKSITLTTTLYYYMENVHYYMMLSDLKEIKKANGTRVHIISKCTHCGKEMRIFENNDVIEASCSDCNIWKRY